MASILKLSLITILAMSLTVTARPIDTKRTLLARLKLESSSSSSSSAPTCWDSLYQLQSCTGEVIQFFYDGQENLGQDCCQAIYVISHNCWPSMLGSLGFNSEETALLQGYCDAEESAPPPSIAN